MIVYVSVRIRVRGSQEYDVHHEVNPESISASTSTGLQVQQAQQNGLFGEDGTASHQVQIRKSQLATRLSSKK